MWQVKLVKEPTHHYYISSFFPRQFYYRKNANQLRDEILERGGEAVVEKAPKPEPSKVR